MGAQAVLMLSLRHPELCRSTIIVGRGSGSVDDDVFVATGDATAMLPRTGHTVNLEEPDLFNNLALRFLSAVEAEGWLVAQSDEAG